MMKQTPREIKIYNDFKPGRISKAGFLGEDDRHVHDIIEADRKLLRKLGLDCESISDRLQLFINEGKKGLETPVVWKDFLIKVFWQRGMISCPFGERGLHHKIIAEVTHLKKGEKIRFSQLSVHLIREHGFFEGRGSVFRLDPENLNLFIL